MRRPIIATLLVALAAGCGSSGPTAVSGGPDQVVIQTFAFNPTPRTVSSGTTVTWINRDPDGHTATGGSGAETWDSGLLSQNASFSHTFNSPGSYQYVCSVHPSMHGTIIVN